MTYILEVYMTYMTTFKKLRKSTFIIKYNFLYLFQEYMYEFRSTLFFTLPAPRTIQSIICNVCVSVCAIAQIMRAYHKLSNL